MECKEFEKLIPDFIEETMDYETLQEFSRHIYDCEDCKEELTIQFLVWEGIQRLEDGDVFDLHKELDLRLTEAKRKLNTYRHMQRITYSLEFVTILMLVGIIVWMMM